MLVERDIPVMFRPLKNLLGAYIDDPGQGVMVTTQRQLPVQRFTAAHELGHAALGHEASLDEEDILTRAYLLPECSLRSAGDPGQRLRDRTSDAAMADCRAHEAARLEARET